jgi:iron complex transport system substrate-binding protein
MVGGSDTSADAILRLAGLVNSASELKGFKPVGDEALLAMAPEFVVIMRSSGNHETATVPSVAGLAASPAGRNNRFLSMDGLYLLGFGPRVASAARDLMREAYPALGCRGAWQTWTALPCDPPTRRSLRGRRCLAPSRCC